LLNRKVQNERNRKLNKFSFSNVGYFPPPPQYKVSQANIPQTQPSFSRQKKVGKRRTCARAIVMGPYILTVIVKQSWKIFLTLYRLHTLYIHSQTEWNIKVLTIGLEIYIHMRTISLPDLLMFRCNKSLL